ncbi:hypothetical protein ACM66B_005562 [Microbotryomycetes sp. NB124-2]
MGKLVWHELGRYMAITCGLYVIWAGAWGIMYRKFFFDFVGGHLGPHGLVPSQRLQFFVKTIVDLPVWQIVNIVNGILTLILESPLHLLKATFVHQIHFLRVALYLWAAACAAIVYQTVDASVFYLITCLVYCRSWAHGEPLSSPSHIHAKAQQRV